ncbi:hypothetical protein ASPVEDRAFT_142658, partial [Aspergillus versicolor CBS 583.65]
KNQQLIAKGIDNFNKAWLVIFSRVYHDPAEPEYDLSPEEREACMKNGLPVQEFTLFLEERLLERCYPGMKIIANVWELNCGFHYFEEVIRAYGSIYTPLANELITGCKKPRAFAAKKKQKESDAEWKAEPTSLETLLTR